VLAFHTIEKCNRQLAIGRDNGKVARALRSAEKRILFVLKSLVGSKGPNITDGLLAALLFVAVMSLGIAGIIGSANAGQITSEYTKLDLDNGCVWSIPESEEEAQMGGDAVCTGFGSYPVYFAEGDLRQFVAFGHVADPMAYPGGFAQFNRVNTTVEWRLEDGRPFATILRWFIENMDQNTGATSEALTGQVLVISTVAEAGTRRQNSCVVGYVDAKANANANVLARQVADGPGKNFRCGRDLPGFYGIRGPLAGAPNDLDR